MMIRRVSPFTYHYPLAILLCVYLFLAGLYALATPLFEAPDEYYHFAVIEYLARTGELPPLEAPPPQTDFQFPSHPWRQMTYHAPLYYQAAAALINLAGIDTTDFPTYRLNPHAQIGIALAQDNANLVAHLGGETVPGIPTMDSWQGAGLAVRLARYLSIALGAVTVISTYALARTCFPSRRRVALLAVLILILIPQFIFITVAVSNDSAVIAFSTLSLALTVYIVRAGDLRWRTILVLGLALACAAASKASGIAPYPLAAFAVAYAVWKTRAPFWRLLVSGVLIAGIGALIAGGWYLRNLTLFGDPTATSVIAAYSAPRGSTPIDLIGEGRGLYYSFWGLFGWFNVAPPLWFYTWTAIYVAVAVVGAGFRLIRQRPRFSRDEGVIAALLIGYCLIVLLGWWRYEQIVFAGQGRLLFPLLGIVCAALAWGFAGLSRPVALAAVSIMGLWAIAMPFLVIAPAYDPNMIGVVGARLASPADDAAPENSVEFLFREPWREDECLRLTAAPISWDGESPIEIDLEWQSLCDIEGYWSVFAHLVDLERETCVTGDTSHILAQADSMPLGGRLPFPAFEAGSVVFDHLTITPPPDLDPSREYHVQVGLYDAAGSFMRAFVRPAEEQFTPEWVSIGRCAPETVVYDLTQTSP
jgi:hypothetical protein